MRQSPVSILLRVVFAGGIVWALYFLRANVWFKLYPAVMVALALTGFAVSLFRTPLIELIARKLGEQLDERGVAYCRNVTRVWVGFLTVHLIVTLATVFAPDWLWAWYNGCFAYLLLGSMLLGERLYRKRVRHG